MNLIKALIIMLIMTSVITPAMANKNDSMKAINQAQVLIESAERNGAQEHAAMLIKSARDQLAKANVQHAERDWVDAEISAKMAQRNAEVADAKSLAMKAKKSYDDLKAVVEILRVELARKRSMQ